MSILVPRVSLLGGRPDVLIRLATMLLSMSEAEFPPLRRFSCSGVRDGKVGRGGFLPDVQSDPKASIDFWGG